MNATAATASMTYADPIEHITGFDTVPEFTEPTVRLYILPGYVGRQKCNASEVMMHMNRTDKFMKFRFNTTEHPTYISESVQLLNDDYSPFSGPVTRSEGGVYANYHEPIDRMYYYYLPCQDLVNDYSELMAAGFTQDHQCHNHRMSKLAEKYTLHPIVLRDVCEYLIHAENEKSVRDEVAATKS